MRFRAVARNAETASSLAFHGSVAKTLFHDDFQSTALGAVPSVAGVGAWATNGNPVTGSVQVVNKAMPNHATETGDTNRYLKTLRPEGDSSAFFATGWARDDTDGRMLRMSVSVWVPSGSNAEAVLCGSALQRSRQHRADGNT